MGSFVYVNKNGFVQQTQTQVTEQPQPQSQPKDQNEIIEKPFYSKNKVAPGGVILGLDMLGGNSDNNNNKKGFLAGVGAGESNKKKKEGVVPMSGASSRTTICGASNGGSEKSLVHTDASSGKCKINSKVAVDEQQMRHDKKSNCKGNGNEPVINNDHVKYINLFSVLCCWCFPITGCAAIIFSRKTRRYYDQQDMQRAKKYLVKSEWMLILTIFFGCTIVGLLFGFFETYLFKTWQYKGMQLAPGVYRTN